jgi:hypothetical protein
VCVVFFNLNSFQEVLRSGNKKSNEGKLIQDYRERVMIERERTCCFAYSFSTGFISSALGGTLD